MKMNIAIVITSTLLLSSSVQAAGWNAEIFGGERNGSSNIDFNKSYGVGVSKQLTPRVSAGVELGYTKNGSTIGRTLMMKGEYDFIRRGGFSAYGGVGLGAIRVRDAHRDTVAGGRVSLGARYRITPRTRLFFEARRTEAFKDPRVGQNGGRVDYGGDTLHLGIKYRF